jgi:LAO/AO transport system kinase
MVEQLDKIAREMQNIVKDGKITCAQARKLAEDLKVPYSDVGAVADEFKIKIHKCQLGCF